MKVYLYELSEEPKHLHYTESDDWIVQVVHDTQESEGPDAKTAPCTIDIELRKSQEVVFLKGKINLELGLLCSRCANGFRQRLSSNFESLFTRDPSLKPAISSRTGTAMSAPTGTTGEDLDIEFLEKDYIELADVLKEQIYLKIPVQPLCSQQCKGICPICGQDQNTQPCQCHRIKNPALANALKNFRFNH